MKLKELHEAVAQSKSSKESVNVLYEINKLKSRILTLETKINFLDHENKKLRKVFIQESLKTKNLIIRQSNQPQEEPKEKTTSKESTEFSIHEDNI